MPRIENLTVKKNAEQIFASGLDALRQRLGESVFKSWLASLSLGELKDGVLTLCLPTPFMCNYIKKNFSADILDVFKTLDPSVSKAVFEVRLSALPEAPAPARPKKEPAEETEYAKSGDSLDDLSAPLDPRFTFDNFVVGKPNEFAHAAARRVAESSVPSFNPLYLYSGVGLGKTHLMHSIAWHTRETNPGRKVVYLSAEKFMHRFIRALRFKDTFEFKEQLRSVDVLMIDDVQFLIGKESTQEEFFHTFNALVDQGKQIVLSADKTPFDLEGLSDRLKSRLGSGLIADIHPTTFELRLGILENKAMAMGVYVPMEVISFLAEKITSNVRELEGALIRVVSHVQLMGGEVTLPRTCEILRDMLNVLERKVTIDDIQRKVSDQYGIRVADMKSKRRERKVALPRQVAMYLSKMLTSKSLPEIGRNFDRDHTTVIHAVKKVEEMMEKDANFRQEVTLLRQIFSV